MEKGRIEDSINIDVASSRGDVAFRVSDLSDVSNDVRVCNYQLIKESGCVSDICCSAAPIFPDNGGCNTCE
jgi:hypothetical protein